MSWSIEGTYFETCSCELMCPCNLSFDHGATYDYCRVTLVFDIREGEIEGTEVDGRTLAVIADTPKVMTEGNWRLGMFVDEGASDEQMEKLTAVFAATENLPSGSAYKPGEKTGHRGFCKNCGVIPYGWVDAAEWNPAPYVSVNVAALDDLDPEELMAAPVQYMNGRDNDWWHAPKETRHL